MSNELSEVTEAMIEVAARAICEAEGINPDASLKVGRRSFLAWQEVSATATAAINALAMHRAALNTPRAAETSEGVIFRIERGDANSHVFDDRLYAGDEGIGFIDEDWSDRLLAALTPSPVRSPGGADLAEHDLQPLAWAIQNVHGYLTDNSCSDPDCCGGPHYSEEDYRDGLATMARHGLTLTQEQSSTDRKWEGA